jgi:hypothetical protein
VSGRWFFPGPPVSSTNKTDHHYITEILLKVTLSTIKQAKTTACCSHTITTTTAHQQAVGVIVSQYKNKIITHD